MTRLACRRQHLITSAILFFTSAPLLAQGLSPDESGHALRDGKVIVGCWNFNAGAGIPDSQGRYQEFLPSLRGWDFRINLPYIQFQLARAAGGASEPTLVGVEENGDIVPYGHINNSIWLFQAGGGDKSIHAKILPSRRDGSSTENVTSLTDGWFTVGSGGPDLLPDKPVAAVVGKGLNTARIYVVARDQAGALYMTGHTVNGGETISILPPIANGLEIPIPGGVIGRPWEDSWVALGVSSSVLPALTEAFDGKLALAYIDLGSGELRVQIYNPADNSWTAPAAISDAAAVHPQLAWDGTALNVLFIQAGTSRLQQMYALSADQPVFFNRRSVSELPAVSDHFHVIAFNHRLHVVVALNNGEIDPPVMYTTTTSHPGHPATWSFRSDTGIRSTVAPQIAWMYENLLVSGVSGDGRIRFARKDPNRPGNAQTDRAGADRWLQAGTDVDPTVQGSFSSLDTVTFNSDVYMAANNSDGGVYVVNFSRAVLKHLITNKWGMKLLWGEPGGARVLRPGEFGGGDEVPALGDVNHDGFQELYRFNQTGNADGNAPVYRHRNIFGDINPTGDVISTDFSHPNEVPMVGDFDGDGESDLINFVQRTQTDFDGNLIGYSPVWVVRSGSPNNGEMWHDDFCKAPEIPYIGDFNGDGKDDIISFTQKVISDFDGHLVAQAAVLVCLSDGNHFGPSQLWHTYFSEPGEIPMVGDFNGDGKDDIVTFTQKNQPPYGTAPVWVALSDGTKFSPATVWHPFFSLPGEVPLVGDLNMDGRDDILTCIADKPGETDHARNIYAAYSLLYKFDNSITWHSDFVTKDQVRRGPLNRTYSPIVGHLSNATLGSITNLSSDYNRPIPDIVGFSSNGSVQIARLMGNVPFAAGAPWERYKFFTDKGIGVGVFPEWIYDQTNHCTAGNNHRFVLNGLGGVGGTDLTLSSVRYGGRAPHILEELGHSISANCFRSNSDPFGLYQSIYEVSPEQGGIGATPAGPPESLPGCPDPNGFLSCRPDSPGEHYFLQLLSRYRFNPEFFRSRIALEIDPAKQLNLTLQYAWFKNHWFEGLEFATGDFKNASLEQPGVPLLPDPEPPVGVEVPLDTGGGTCGSGGACGMGAPLMLLLTMTGLRFQRRNRRSTSH